MIFWISILWTTPPSMRNTSTPADLTDINFETLCIANEFTYSILSTAFYYLVFLLAFPKLRYNDSCWPTRHCFDNHALPKVRDIPRWFFKYTCLAFPWNEFSSFGHYLASYLLYLFESYPSSSIIAFLGLLGVTGKGKGAVWAASSESRASWVYFCSSSIEPTCLRRDDQSVRSFGMYSLPSKPFFFLGLAYTSFLANQHYTKEG